MAHSETEAALTILLVGGCIVTSILIKSGLERRGFPTVVGFIALGILLRLSDAEWPWITPGVQGAMNSLGTLGIVALMFRVGLESDLVALLRELRTAEIIWVGNVALSGLLGFLASYCWLDLPLIPSLFIAVALTATSVAIPVGIWRDANALQSRHGQLLLDVAELDDVSAVLLIAALVAIAPDLSDGTLDVHSLWQTTGALLLRLLGFAVICMLFSRVLEPRVTEVVRRLEPAPDAMLLIAGTGFLIAALAGFLGFSVAMGAFFAGLVFSRDPEAVRMDTRLEALHDLFAPFFFIDLGMSLNPEAFQIAWYPGLVLAFVAIIGKFAGTLAPAWPLVGMPAATLLAVSMVPRAEIALVVMHQGIGQGNWGIDESTLAMMVIVSAVTSLLAPIVLRALLARIPQAS